MDFSDFARGMSFRFIKPKRHRPTGFRGLSRLLAKLGIDLERMNTNLPADANLIASRLSALATVPRMSTFGIGALINQAVSQMAPGECFLNIGVWNGYTYLCGMAGHQTTRCIGVDNFTHPNAPKEAWLQRWEKFRSPNHRFVEADFRDYLRDQHREPVGVYLFDGPHTYQDQYDALILAEPYFASNCIVLIDDTNHEQVRRANLDFMKKSRNSYSLLLDCPTAHNGHPTFWNGLMVFRLAGQNRVAHPSIVKAA